VDWYNADHGGKLPEGAFSGDDGLMRDSSGVHGSYRPGRITEAALGKILEALEQLSPSRLELILDAPISFSGEMAEELRRRAPAAIPCEVSVSPSADYPLKSFPGLVATSDSSIIDRAAIREVLDLARFVLERGYGARVAPVGQLLIPQQFPDAEAGDAGSASAQAFGVMSSGAAASPPGRGSRPLGLLGKRAAHGLLGQLPATPAAAGRQQRSGAPGCRAKRWSPGLGVGRSWQPRAGQRASSAARRPARRPARWLAPRPRLGAPRRPAQGALCSSPAWPAPELQLLLSPAPVPEPRRSLFQQE
jgi:hypothetical protein